MNVTDNRLIQAAETVINFLLLNLLWLVASLPIVTAYPATAALFSVVRGWQRQEDSAIVATFFRAFRENLKQSLLVGIAWTLLGVVLLVDLVAARRMPTVLSLPLSLAAVALGLLYLLTSLYIFPVMVNFHTTSLGIVRNAFILAMSQPLVGLLTLACLVALAAVTLAVPFVLLCSGSIAAYCLYAVCDRAMRKAAPDEYGGEAGEPEP